MKRIRVFTDDDGRQWVASVRPAEGAGLDYKGRFEMVISPDGEGEAFRAVPLPEVRWNSERTAERTLRTMSEFELRRRLRSALSRVS